VAPGPRIDQWAYLSVGAWEVDHDASNGLEFLVIAPRDDPRQVEFLAMTAHYHHGERLGRGHTFPLGQAWLPGSQLNHALVSLPYPFGPNLEICDVDGGHLHFLWLLPISSAEHTFLLTNGVEALEQRFEDSALRYWEPGRKSVV